MSIEACHVASRVAKQASNYAINIIKYLDYKDKSLVSIVMSYFNTKNQIVLTLNYIEKIYANKYNI